MAVTRIAVTDIVATMRAITSVSTGSYAIVNQAFSATATSGLRFAGAFPGFPAGEGHGPVRAYGLPSCTSADGSWAAADHCDAAHPGPSEARALRLRPSRQACAPGCGTPSSVTTLYVAIGGALGVLARFGVGRVTLHHDWLLWSTVAINVVGSFLLGLLVAGRMIDRDLREGLGVGFLGGFTTFSTFSVQAVLEWDGGEPARAMLYVGLSVGGGLVAATAGYALGRALL